MSFLFFWQNIHCESSNNHHLHQFWYQTKNFSKARTITLMSFSFFRQKIHSRKSNNHAFWKMKFNFQNYFESLKTNCFISFAIFRQNIHFENLEIYPLELSIFWTNNSIWKAIWKAKITLVMSDKNHFKCWKNCPYLWLIKTLWLKAHKLWALICPIFYDKSIKRTQFIQSKSIAIK